MNLILNLYEFDGWVCRIPSNSWLIRVIIDRPLREKMRGREDVKSKVDRIEVTATGLAVSAY